MSWPHVLSISRVAAGPVVAVLVLAGSANALLWAAAIFSLASLTDLLDGPLARRARSVSPVGIYLDTTADKVFVSIVLVALAITHLLDAWVAMVIVGREFLVSGVRSLAAVEGVVISANYAGKVKATITMIAIVVVLIAGNVSRGGVLQPIDHIQLLQGLAWWGMAISAGLTIQSGIGYILGARPLFSAVEEPAFRSEEPTKLRRVVGSGDRR